jgi:hypothetical protein
LSSSQQSLQEGIELELNDSAAVTMRIVEKDPSIRAERLRAANASLDTSRRTSMMRPCPDDDPVGGLDGRQCMVFH